MQPKLKTPIQKLVRGELPKKVPANPAKPRPRPGSTIGGARG